MTLINSFIEKPLPFLYSGSSEEIVSMHINACFLGLHIV